MVFGNGKAKPRVCVVVEKQNDKLRIAPLQKRDTAYVILDRDCDRQISNNSNGKVRWISSNEVYETKYISGVLPLTKYDKAKIKAVFNKNNRNLLDYGFANSFRLACR